MDLISDAGWEICIYFSSFLGSMEMNYLNNIYSISWHSENEDSVFVSFCLQFQWLDHLNRLFADHGISLNKSQNIIVSDPEYLQKMSEDVLATNAS